MWQLKIFFVFILGFFMNVKAGVYGINPISATRKFRARSLQLDRYSIKPTCKIIVSDISDRGAQWIKLFELYGKHIVKKVSSRVRLGCMMATGQACYLMVSDSRCLRTAVSPGISPRIKDFTNACPAFLDGVVGRILPEGNLRIVGGEEVNITEYPHQVSVMFKGEHHCGGSIISEKYVLTAAHCISLPRPDAFQIRAGSSFWAKDGVLYDVESLTPHPKFSFDVGDYDIGVIKISGTFEINDETIKIVKLADASTKLATGDLVTVTGWGSTGTLLPLSDILKAGSLPIFDHDNCIEVWKDVPITENMVCAGYLEPLQSACYGDSGGPLVDGDMVQHGIVSFGPRNCKNEDFPNVYSSVASLRSWIKENSGV